MDVIAHTRGRSLCGRLLGSLPLLAWVLAGAVSSAAAAGRAGPVARAIERDGGPVLVARLLRDHADADGHGEKVGVLFDLAPGWHVYWRSAGDTGLPPELAWEAEGAEFGPILWPVPRAFQAGGSEPDAASYGYEGQVLLASEVRTGPEGLGRVAVDAEVLVCEHECIPASFRLERGRDQALAGLSASEEDALFARFAARLPTAPGQLGVELSAAWSQSVVRPGDAFEGAIAVRGGEDAEASFFPDAFFPDDMESVELRIADVRHDAAEPGLWWVVLTGQADPDQEIGAERLTGVVGLRDSRGEKRHVELDLPFPSAPAGTRAEPLGRPWDPASAARSTPMALGMLEALLLALLGGLVLNLMPCVLPVLAIKVFSLSEMAHAVHAGRAEPLRHGLAYTGGILLSMAALGSAVVALRAAGHSVGWGFQFQEPIYVAAISAVLVAFALNLFGAFEIHGGAGPLSDLGQQATGARRSFFEGLLAVALATPCSAPFLGTAVGFAFAAPPAWTLGIFVAIGLGLAAPFLLVSWVPAWARFVPRSGAWMQVVRRGLGFVLLATVLWLLSIYGGSAGSDGIVILVGFLLALSFALWGFGLLQRSERPRMTWAAGAAVLLLGAVGLNAVAARVGTAGDAASAARTSSDSEGAWQVWSPETLRRHLDAGTPVFVRFTADWCITCKVNERLALSDAEVRAGWDRAGFALLVGDWTQRDEAIRSELARHGRAGVPLYLVYRPDRPDDPEVLPELLTPDLVLGAVRRAAPRPAALKPAGRTGR